MDFTFSEEQLAFRDSIKRYLMNEFSPELIRELWTTETGRFPGMWQTLAQQGLTAISVPEANGGLGLSEEDWILLAEQCGYFGMFDSLLDTSMVAVGVLAGLEDAGVRDQWLERIAAGGARVAVGHPLNPFVADAHVADLLLLSHNNEVHAVAPDEVRMERVESLDPSRRMFQLDWYPGAAVAGADEGQRLWAHALDQGALASSAQLLGLTQRMLDISIDYVAERKQFGKPVGSFQAVKHRLADVVIQLEFAKPVVHRAANALAQGSPLRSVYISQAKVAAATVAAAAARNCIQVQGAMGYTWEMDLHIFMKRAWALDGLWGDRAHHKQRMDDYVLSEGAQLGAGATFEAGN
ncbi:MAG: acyl-CoA dehydrogenase family protein [Pseudomonas sp.]